MSGSLKKLNLICVGPIDITYDHIKWVIQDYFALTAYDPSKTYNKKTDILAVSRPFHWNDHIKTHLLDQGFKMLIVDLWEARPYFLSKDLEEYLDNILVILGCKNSLEYGWKNVLNVPNWFWYNESLMYTCDYRCQGYQDYVPNRTKEKLFLMPMHRAKEFRNQIRDQFAPILDQAVWSYVESWQDSRTLPRQTESLIEEFLPDRIFEASWYDQTCFTVAVETAVDSQTNSQAEHDGKHTEAFPCELFVTEKTFKPIAFRHPFQVAAMPGTLQFLKDNGFETYENLFDERYDSMPFFNDRLDLIYKNCEQFNRDIYLDILTEQKIEHNHQLFYNRGIVLDSVHTQLIEPMLEWINQ